MKKVAGRLKLELSQYRELEAFAQFGSELDVETQKTLARGERLVKTLNQKERQPLPVEDQVVQVYAATNGYLDRIKVDRVEEFLVEVTLRFHSEQQELGKKIAGGEWSDEIQQALDKFVKEFANDFGYDLDEEGQPLEEGAAPDRMPEREAAAGQNGGEPKSEEAEEPEPEPEAAAV
jgi:F-type H+-transporting ATPase subunit alpha